jgi:hypothetical protein
MEKIIVVLVGMKRVLPLMLLCSNLRGTLLLGCSKEKSVETKAL